MDKVLVVDDAPTVRALVTHMVSQLGFEAIAVDSGPKAIEMAARIRPRAVLMDLDMARMRGDAACRVLKRMLGNTPIVMMTVADHFDEIRACHQAGADDFLPKPVRLEQLASKLEAAAGTHRPVGTPRKLRQVIWVEPDVRERDLVCCALEYSGYVVFPVGNLADATLCLRNERVDLLMVGSGTNTTTATALLELASQHKVTKLLRLSKTAVGAGAVASHQGVSVTRFQSGSVESVVQKANAMLNRITVDLRSSERKPFFAVARFRRPGAEEWLTGYTSDLSTGGLCLRTLNPVDPLTQIEIQLHVKASPDQTVRGVVAWTRPFHPRPFLVGAPGMGVKFDSPHQGMLDKIALGQEAKS
ncbi:MAG: response regulator [Myxococcaceae bacterium]